MEGKMIVEKSGKQYEVAERRRHWSVVLKSGSLTVDFQVSKDICATIEELKKYIQKEDMF